MSVRRILLRRDTAFNWSQINPALRQGEIGIELADQDSTGGGGRIKIGDGFTSWNDLSYVDDYTLDAIRAEYGDEATFELHFELNKS
jgi:hypothetical protein